MRRVSLIVLAAFVAGLSVASLAFAAKPRDRVEIQTDQAKGVVRFVIDGKPVAAFDKVGLHVDGDVMYGGVIEDTGRGPGVWGKP
jgi:hypothetical protein